MNEMHHTQLQPSAALYAALPPPLRPATHRTIEPTRQRDLETRRENLQFSQQRAVIELLNSTAEHFSELAEVLKEAEEQRAEMRQQIEHDERAARTGESDAAHVDTYG